MVKKKSIKNPPPPPPFQSLFTACQDAQGRVPLAVEFPPGAMGSGTCSQNAPKSSNIKSCMSESRRQQCSVSNQIQS